MCAPKIRSPPPCSLHEHFGGFAGLNGERAAPDGHLRRSDAHVSNARAGNEARMARIAGSPHR
jgi:hypothetical protein